MILKDFLRGVRCIVMASGCSRRYGKDKLLEPLDGRALLLHTLDSLKAAGLEPLVVTRNAAIRELVAGEGFPCVLHDGPNRSDTLRAGLTALGEGAEGWLFMPGDQPLVRADSLRRMLDRFAAHPDRALRLGYGDAVGSPVIFPAVCREDLMALEGDRGGMDVIRTKKIPCDIAQARYPWELWDVDTPDDMARVRAAYFRFVQAADGNVSG